MNGRARWWVAPSIVTCTSCMHSSSADWVLGLARLISSTSTRLANTGPGRNSNSFDCMLNTLTPVMSEGSRSGVAWMRANSQSSDRAIDFASIVLPTPGKSSRMMWPSTQQRHHAPLQQPLRRVNHAGDVGDHAAGGLARIRDRLGLGRLVQFVCFHRMSSRQTVVRCSTAVAADWFPS